MIYKILFINIIVILNFQYAIPNNPADSLHFKNQAGIHLGYLNYASIDNIQTPYIYYGNSIAYGIKYRRYSNNKLNELVFNYSSFKRTPKNVQIPEFYYLKAIEKDQKLKVTPEQHFQYIENYNLDFRYSFEYKIFNNLFFKDRLYFGGQIGNYAVLNKDIGDFEIFSIYAGPRLTYYISINERFDLFLQSHLPFIANTIRLPYANASAQLTDDYGLTVFQYFNNYSKVLTVNNYFQVNSTISFSFKLSDRIQTGLEYNFIYINCKKPRPLYIVSNRFDLTFTVNF